MRPPKFTQKRSIFTNPFAHLTHTPPQNTQIHIIHTTTKHTSLSSHTRKRASFHTKYNSLRIRTFSDIERHRATDLASATLHMQ